MLSQTRDYDRACERLQTLERYFATEGRLERLAALQIQFKTDHGHPPAPREFIDGLEKLVRDDLQRYGAKLIHAAQDDVRAAAKALQAAVNTQLAQMRD